MMEGASNSHPRPASFYPKQTAPTNEQNLIAELARQSDEDESALLLGLRQDVLDHVQFLDSFSYNNVFVGEERQILGTKIDFATPRLGERATLRGRVRVRLSDTRRSRYCEC